ncbi:uncharacterized protein TNCV_967191 [Trichonephila clavipes]|nr:uncharacterized protein TNCV_967191 [Trichonephila clavipes]
MLTRSGSTMADFSVMMVAVDLKTTADREDILIVRSTVTAPDSSSLTIRRATHTDEFRFQLCPDDHRRRVWRQPRQRAYPAFTIERPTGPQPEVMVWDAISFDSRTPLVNFRATLTAQWCIYDILRTVLLPFLLQYLGLIFQNIRPDHMGHACCYELPYGLSNTSLASQIARYLFNIACLGYDGKATASTREC